MNVLENMNDALSYIEDHLTEEIDFKEVTRRALCSEYHFKRMFSFLAGVPLSEYIRRRRLTIAAYELQQSQLRIIDVAVHVGYSSPDAFTKAFQLFHGVTPSEARAGSPSLKSFPRMTFQLTIRGGSAMNYRIEEKKAFRIVGLKKRVPIQFSGVNREIATMGVSYTPLRAPETPDHLVCRRLIAIKSNTHDGLSSIVLHTEGMQQVHMAR
ncbi:hypothetical protein AMQ83_04680, partial [Paenibacillus riograndensis]